MKSLSKIIGIAILFSSFSAGAVNVKVKGVPVTLIPYKQIYQLPANYNFSNNGYLYVSVGGVNSVCYTQENPSLQTLKMQIITININGQNADWNCYETGTSS